LTTWSLIARGTRGSGATFTAGGAVAAGGGDSDAMIVDAVTVGLGGLGTSASLKTTSAFRNLAIGFPSCVAGLNFQRRFTIAQAASSSAGLPLDAVTVQSP